MNLLYSNQTDNPDKFRAGVGMPAALLLKEFADKLWDIFGEPPYWVGSSANGKSWRDVDIRIMLDADKYAQWELGDPKNPHANAKWCALVTALSLLGQQMTGLPIDFQIQETATANAEFPDSYRGAIVHPRRYAKSDAKDEE